MGRDRTVTEDSFLSTSYTVLNDEENVMNLEPCQTTTAMTTTATTAVDTEHQHMDDPYCAPLLLDGEENDRRHSAGDQFILLDNLDDDELTNFLFSSHEPTQLNGLNYLNIVTYILHLFVSWGIGMWGLDGVLETRVDILSQQATLLTPAKWSYWIWLPILLCETVFAIAQLLPEYRARPIVQDGTSFFFFYTFLSMTVWTLCFAFRLFLLSFISVLFALISLASLLISQHRSSPLAQQRRRRFKEEYYLFRLPFMLHFGWMVVMAAVHLCLLLKYEASSSLPVQLGVDVVALAVLLPVATSFILQPQEEYRNHVIPAVILWAYIGIAWQLHQLLEDHKDGAAETAMATMIANHTSNTTTHIHTPSTHSEELLELYGEEVVQGFEIASWCLAGITTILLVPSVVIWVCKEYLTIRVVQLEHSVDSVR